MKSNHKTDTTMMKNYLILLFVALGIVGCSQDETITEGSNEMITVSLKLNGEISSTESPITRADTESRDLIAIAVYKIKTNNTTEKFAYGIYDNLNNVTINLLAGFKYKFKCTLIKDAKDKLYFSTQDETSTSRFYGTYPFRSNEICNAPFIYKTYYNDYSSENYVSTSGYQSQNYCAKIDRFYGETNDYTPTVNGVVTIDLKRVSFGLKVKVTGITDGSADVTCKKGSYNTFVSQTGLTSNYESAGEMFSMYNIYDAWQYANSDYQEQVQVSVVWTRGVGIVQDLGTQNVYVKRNVMNIIHIKLSSDDNDVDVGVDPEDDDMDDEEDEIG